MGLDAEPAAGVGWTQAKGVTLLRGQSRLGPEALGASRVPPPRGSRSQTHTAPGVSHLPLQLGFLASPPPSGAPVASSACRAGVLPLPREAQSQRCSRESVLFQGVACWDGSTEDEYLPTGSLLDHLR